MIRVLLFVNNSGFTVAHAVGIQLNDDATEIARQMAISGQMTINVDSTLAEMNQRIMCAHQFKRSDIIMRIFLYQKGLDSKLRFQQ